MSSQLSTNSEVGFFQGLLPQPPWLGPPLPRFMGIFWPWSQGITAGLGDFASYFTGNFEFRHGSNFSAPSEEEVELVRDSTGAILKMIKRRN